MSVSIELGAFWLHALDGGALSFAVPGRTRPVELAVRPVLVVGPAGSCLYDTGFGDADGERRRKFRLRDPEPLERQVLALGLPEGPDVVLLSHLHFDHAGGALTGHGDAERLRFPRARHVLHADEWQAAIADGRGSRLAERLERAGPPDRIDDGAELLPGLRVTRHRGHTEGLLVLHGEQPGARFLLPGDLVPTRHFLRPREDRVADQDAARALAERTRLLDALAATDGVLGLYHDRDRAFVRLKSCGVDGYAAQDDPPR